MRLLSVDIPRFRNLADVKLVPGPRSTVLVGENGQGKTNTLEAIWYSATLKPLRGTRLAELVPFDRPLEGALVRTEWMLPGGPRRYAVRVLAGERQLEIDGKRAPSLDDYLGATSVVAFTPDDLSLIKGAPDGRRRFLDRAVFGRHPVFLSESRDYARALKARNRLLREGSPEGVREAFDAQLARLGARVWRRRLDLVEELAPQATRAFEAVGRLAVALSLRYRPAAVALDARAEETAFEQVLLEALETRKRLDAERKFTSVGPHADDLQLLLGEKSARLYGSQGQQRAIVLALKIGEIENLRAHRGAYPLLLLDDVSSELDPERNRFLMAYLRKLDAQVLLTTTDFGLVREATGDDVVVMQVRSGAVQPA